jgi:hypothetical protein
MTRMNSSLTLGYSILAGPVLWFVHFVLVYAVAEFGCRANFNNLLVVTPGTIQILILVISAIILVLVGAAALFAYRAWQAARHNGISTESSHYDFLAMMGVLLSALFLFIIVFTTLPTFFLSVCDMVA